MKLEDVFEAMVKKRLIENGYDGLCDPDEECECSLEDLMPCGRAKDNILYHCAPGHKGKCEDGVLREVFEETVRKWLVGDGYDGLCDPDEECGCSLEDFGACGNDAETILDYCEPGYKGTCENGEDGIFNKKGVGE